MTFVEQVLLQGAALLLLMVLFAISIMAFKRRWFKSWQGQTPFELEKLEQMKSDGLLSDEEFTRIRRKMFELDDSKYKLSPGNNEGCEHRDATTNLKKFDSVLSDNPQNDDLTSDGGNTLP